MKLKLGSYRVFVVGIIMGLSAAAIQAYFEVQPPVAYGIAFIGHPNNLLTWTTNEFLGTNFPVREAFILLPPLTVIGVFIGSYVAAYRNKELGWRPGPVRKKFAAVMFGFLVVNFGLLWGACPIRTTLLVSYGNVMAVIALFSIAVGVILACLYIRLRVKKGTFR